MERDIEDGKKRALIETWMLSFLNQSTDRQVGRQVDRQMDGQIDIRMDGWIDGQRDGWVDKINGQMDRQIDG